MKGAGEAAPGLVAAGSHVGKKLATGRHRLLQALDGDIELFLRLPVLPDQAGGHRSDVEDPGIVIGEPALGVVRGQCADPPIAGRPRDRDRVVNAQQPVLLPQRVESGRGATADIELVPVNQARGDAVVAGLGLDAKASDWRLSRKAVRLALKHQVSCGREPKEGHAAGADQAGDRFGEMAEEGGQFHLGLEVGGNGAERNRGCRLSFLESLRRTRPLARPKLAVGAQAPRLRRSRRTRRPATGRQGGYLHVAPPESLCRPKSKRSGEGYVAVQVR